MNDTDFSSDSPAFLGSLHLPLALIGVALSINFCSELRSAGKNAETMRWQLSGLDRQTESLSGAKRELAGIIQKNDEVVKQAQQIQGQYTALFNDLLELAKDDKDAKEVVEKWGIKRAGGQAVEAAPVPAPAPAPAAATPPAEAPKPDSKAPALR